MHYERLIFKHNIDPDDPEIFEKFATTIEQLTLMGCGFTLMSDEENPTDRTHKILWQMPDDVTELTFLRDENVEIASLSIKSLKSGLVRRIARTFTENFDCYTLKELIAKAKTDYVQNPNILMKMTLAAKREDLEIVKIIETALASYLPGVRYYATRAIALNPWKIFTDALESMLKMEMDSTVKESAQYALHLCQKTANL